LIFELPVKVKCYNKLLRRKGATVGVLETAGFSCVRMIIEHTSDEYWDLLLSFEAFIDEANIAARINAL